MQSSNCLGLLVTITSWQIPSTTDECQDRSRQTCKIWSPFTLKEHLAV